MLDSYCYNYLTIGAALAYVEVDLQNSEMWGVDRVHPF